MFLRNIIQWLVTRGMIGIDDVNVANYDTTQSSQQIPPGTIAAAATIVPTNFLTFITGTTQIATITPPLSGAHMLVFIFTNGSPGALLTSGNIKAAVTPIQNIPLVAIYDPSSAKYWCGTLKAS